jgi:hypothetical protein
MQLMHNGKLGSAVESQHAEEGLLSPRSPPLPRLPHSHCTLRPDTGIPGAGCLTPLSSICTMCHLLCSSRRYALGKGSDVFHGLSCTAVLLNVGDWFFLSCLQLQTMGIRSTQHSVMLSEKRDSNRPLKVCKIEKHGQVS